MRALDEIDAEIAAVARRLADLEDERRAARQRQIDHILRLFDAGQSRHDIARQVGLTPPAVTGILWRNGRTDANREERRHRGANTTERLDQMLRAALNRGASA